MQTRRETLIAYLLSSVEAEDWHAVRDAAVDIEVLDARDETCALATPRPLCTGQFNGCNCISCIKERGSIAGFPQGIVQGIPKP